MATVTLPTEGTKYDAFDVTSGSKLANVEKLMEATPGFSILVGTLKLGVGTPVITMSD